VSSVTLCAMRNKPPKRQAVLGQGQGGVERKSGCGKVVARCGKGRIVQCAVIPLSGETKAQGENAFQLAIQSPNPERPNSGARKGDVNKQLINRQCREGRVHPARRLDTESRSRILSPCGHPQEARSGNERPRHPRASRLLRVEIRQTLTLLLLRNETLSPALTLRGSCRVAQAIRIGCDSPDQQKMVGTGGWKGNERLRPRKLLR
jgi:hypothetical protein